MTLSAYAGLVIMVLLAIVAIKTMRPRRRSTWRRAGGVGSAAAGSFYELLSEERRNAIEVIVEDKAGYRDPEDAGGNLPDLGGRGPRPGT
jgi:hypothetical protein